MIVFSDMDGTLLTSDKQMSDATWAMLDELARRGIEFVPCTGRPLSGIFEPILAHPAVHYAVCANGASVWQLDEDAPTDASRAKRILSRPLDRGIAHPAVHYAVCANGASVWQLDEDAPTDASRAKRILSRPLDRGIAHRIHRIAAGHDVTFDIFADGQCFLPRSLYERLDEFCGGDPHIAASLKRTRTPIDMDIDSKIDEVETLERIAMYWHDPADRDAIAAELDTLGGIEVTRSYAMNIEVMGEGATKGTALTWLCEHLGERLADAWGFGDNINDIPMLQAAGHGIAMINGEPEDRDAADAITEFDNDHDGVARTIMAALA